MASQNYLQVMFILSPCKLTGKKDSETLDFWFAQTS